MPKKMSEEEFIARAKKIHGDSFDYSNSSFLGTAKPFHAECKRCGHVTYFKQAHYHISNASGCDICGESRPRNLSTEDFVKRICYKYPKFQEYDFSLFQKIAWKVKSTVTCPCGHRYESSPNNLSEGKGCQICAGKALKPLEQFIKEAKEIHGNHYDYSKAIYKGASVPIEIICPIHGSIWPTPNTHLRGHGCKYCSYENATLTTEEFITKAQQVHGSSYSYKNTRYVNSKTEVEIYCIRHQQYFRITPSNHLAGRGCLECGKEGFREKQSKPLTEFLKESHILYGEWFDYSQMNYKSGRGEVEIICPIHGAFKVIPLKHLNGQGCPLCSMSRGETRVHSLLSSWELQFEFQKRFENCRDVYPLPFDFYLLEYNLCVEYDGELHYEPSRYTGGMRKLVLTRYHDTLKNKYCQENNINLLRIPYWEFDNIEDILTLRLKYATKVA